MREPFHRLTLRIPVNTYALLQERAAAQELQLAELGREALEEWLRPAPRPVDGDAVDQLQVVGLATLLAAEHVIRFLGRSFPEGERRLLELKESAAEAAELRLEEVKERLDREAAR